jgi:hypothetical protein
MEFILLNHVENRRLLAAAAGNHTLDEWERQHVHSCEVCQGVFYVFIRQVMAGSYAPPSKNPPAA